MKLKTKLGIIFGLILAIILGVTTLYGLYSVDSLAARDSKQLLEVRVNLKVKALEQKLGTIFSTLQMAADEIQVTGMNKLNVDSAVQTLENIKNNLGAVEGFMGLENGTTYASGVGVLKDFNAKEKGRGWYRSIFEYKKKYFIGKPYLSVTTNKYVVPTGVEVVRDNQAVAVLCIDLELGDITNFITNISSNKDFFLTNEDGVIFASKDPEEVGKNLFEVFPSFKEYNDKSEFNFDFIWKKMGDQKYKIEGKSLEMLDWHFWQYQSYEEINKVSNDYLYKSIIFFILFLAVSLIIVYFVASYIAKPIIATSKVLSRFAETGDTDLKEGVQWSHRKDEIGVMAKSFDHMINVLRGKAITAKEIAKGNLRVDVAVLSGKDDLGLAFNQMVTDLNSILGQVNTSVDQVTTAAGEISISSNSLSDGATTQAASIEEISASITELSGQTKANAENAAAASKIAQETASAATDGQKRMNELTEAMTEISKNAEKTQKVIKTIDDIAFQTNLLALNAAVEAARAGIHGKGFAVVAEEVRNLAARSAKAAAETADLIHNSNSKVNEGVEVSKLTAESLSKISDNVIKTTDTIEEISAASHEQAEGISQIGIGLEQIDSVTQGNTANAEETASASEEMSAQAITLQGLVQHFKLKDSADNRVLDKKVVKKVKSVNLKKTPSASRWRDAGSVSKAQVVNPKDQIKLDDDDFGKY